MLETFEIRNFRSILDLKVDFRYGENAAPRHYQESETWPFLQTRSGKNGRFVPVLAIYGANASGKSNVINAFLNFNRLLVQGVVGCYQPNKLNGRYGDAGYAAVVQIGESRYRYEVKYDEKCLLGERLILLGATPNKDRVLFSIEGSVRVYDGVVTEGYDFDRMETAVRIECTDGNGLLVKPFLSCLARTFPGLTDFAPKLVGELAQRLQISNRNEFFISQGVDLLAQFNTPEARRTAMSKIVKILRKFDFGVRDMTLDRQKIAKQPSPIPGLAAPPFRPMAVMRDGGDAWIVDEFKLVHEDASGKLKPLDYATEESDGTKVIAALIGVCLWALETGKMLFVDELDRSLHPFILVSLIRLFKSKRYNKTNAQLVFTAHDATPLEDELLRVSEVGIVDKTLERGTSFRRICDFDDVRNVTNFRKQYLSGAYSGIPFPYI